MKAIDMDTVVLVHSGDVWPHETPPCCKRMIRFLEKNESMVTWVQPKQGSVKDQFPVIRVNKEYYTMSLRMMKAVWSVLDVFRVILGCFSRDSRTLSPSAGAT